MSFEPLSNIKPFFKAALQGFAGTGKTYTAALIAAGLHKYIGSTKPIAIFDTEEAAKHLRGFFAEHKIEALVWRSRSLADLRKAMKECRDGRSDILIIDSISHVWEDVLRGYIAKYNRKRGLEFADWGRIKPLWKEQFADPFVRDSYHCIMCGRAGYEYANEVNEQTGRREIYKSGIKMKVEGETAYEPDMLILMERFEKVLSGEREFWREATVIKDRTTVVDGKTFRNPTFEDFLPAIKATMEDPSDPGERVDTPIESLLEDEERTHERKRRVKVALEEVEGLMTSLWPGTTKEAKKAKVDALQEYFGTRSWKAVEGMRLEAIEDGLRRMNETAAENVERSG